MTAVARAEDREHVRWFLDTALRRVQSRRAQTPGTRYGRPLWMYKERRAMVEAVAMLRGVLGLGPIDDLENVIFKIEESATGSDYSSKLVLRLTELVLEGFGTE